MGIRRAKPVDAPEFLRCYLDKTTALRSAKSRSHKARGQQVFVEKVRTNTAGVHNPHAKGAKVIWTNK
jgi:hypothetical protein